MTNFNPIRRTPIKPKAKEHKESAPWRAKKIRLNAKEMAELRSQIYMRSHGQCENTVNQARCTTRLTWYTMHLHHQTHRSLGGSDTRQNCIALCGYCHLDHHDRNTPVTPHEGWQP